MMHLRHVSATCCRELITSEIIFWLYQILTGNDKEFLAWPAAANFTSRRKQLGLGSGSLQDWIQDLLQKVVFKVKHMICKAELHKLLVCCTRACPGFFVFKLAPCDL